MKFVPSAPNSCQAFVRNPHAWMARSSVLLFMAMALYGACFQPGSLRQQPTDRELLSQQATNAVLSLRDGKPPHIQLASTRAHSVAIVSSAAEEEQQLNIIFLMSDDQRWDHIGPYNDEMSTPALDSLAAEGVVFDNAFYAVSICHPSRATVLLGQHPGRHRYGFEEPNQQTISDAEFAQSYPGVMRTAGYYTGFIGKFGVMVTQEKVNSISNGRRGFDELSNMPVDAFDYWAGWEGQAPRGQYWPTENWGGPEAAQIEIGEPGRTHLTRLMGDHIAQFLTTRPQDQPFCLSVSYHAPKALGSSRNIDPEYWPLFEEQEYSVPGNYSQETASYLPRVIRENYRGTRIHRRATGTPEKFQDNMRMAATHAYGIDQTVDRLVQLLKEQGIYDQTVIVYTSDNGFMYGDHGLYGKILAHEGSIRAPLIIRDPRTPTTLRGTRCDAMVSTIDYAPTLISAAGLEVPDCIQGSDLAPFFRGEAQETWRDAVYICNARSLHLSRSSSLRFPLVTDANPQQREYLQENSLRFRAARTERWKYVCYYELSPVVEELFDLESDPLERIDLVEDDRFAEKLVEMRVLCEKLHDESR